MFIHHSGLKLLPSVKKNASQLDIKSFFRQKFMQSFFSETPDNSPAPLLSTHRLDPTVLYNRIWQKNHLNSTLHGGFYSSTKTNPSPPCLVQKIRLVHKSWTWCVWVSPFTRLLCFLLCLWNITTALVALQWRFSVLEKKSIKLEVEITILIYRGLDQDLSAENVEITYNYAGGEKLKACQSQWPDN